MVGGTKEGFDGCVCWGWVVRGEMRDAGGFVKVVLKNDHETLVGVHIVPACKGGGFEEEVPGSLDAFETHQ